jgi:class 3 adenylate cyclase/tetratricopeptide (TPR) repeat protein
MAQAEIEKIQQSIAALEAQRHTLGDSVVDSTVTLLREKLADLQANQTAEQRKKVTVLFADLVGSTELSARLDPEDLRDLLSGCFAAWNASISAYGGSVEKYIGDAVMAVFGLAVVNEDDPEHAVRAALEMHQKLAEFNMASQPRHGLRLAMRVGICTGEVVVGSIGERLKDEFVVVGDTVNLASRLQGAAPEGGTLIDHDTKRRIGGIFEIQALDPIRLKGVAEPVKVYLVHGARPRAFTVEPRSVDGTETRLIGRAVEFERLQSAFSDTVAAGACRFVTLAGEAGIGKSRLIYEFANWLELSAAQPRVFQGRAYPLAQHISYSLVRSLFSFRFRIHDNDAPSQVWDKLVHGLGPDLASGDPEHLRAQLIGRLLGFELPDSPAWQPGSADARQFQDQATGYLLEYFQALVHRGPVVVLLEDIHWADDSSVDLLRRLSGALARQPLLLIAAARPELFARRPDWGRDLPLHDRLDLRPLPQDDCQRLVEEILQAPQGVPPAVRDLVVGQAEGNPYFIEEGIKMLVDEGVMEKQAGRWVAHPTRLHEFRIPPTLEGLLLARLDSLPAGQRVLLQRASVLGRVFWDQALASLSQAEAVPPDAGLSHLHEALGSLSAREVIYRQALSTFAGAVEYLFKHALLRDVTYESLLKRDRRVYHARAARWHENMAQSTLRADENAALIAQHYEQAGQSQPAAHWYRRAGQLAASRYANAEAVYAFSRAHDLTPASAVRDAYEIILAREQVLDRLGQREDQQSDLSRLAQLAETLGDAAATAEAALRQAHFSFVTGDYATAFSAAQRAIQRAQATGNREQEARGYFIWGRSLDFQQAGPQSLEILEKALELARAAGLPRLEANILMSLGPHFSDLIEFERSRSYLTAALEIYRRLGDRHGEAKALGNIGVTYWGQGDYAQAEAYFQDTLKIVREVGDRMIEGIVLGNLGVLAHETLDYGASLGYHAQALEISREVHDRHGQAIHLGNRAEGARDLGDFEQARSGYDQALAIARELGIVQVQSGILLSSSLLFEYLGDAPAAAERARQALALAQETQNALYESASLLRLGQALLAVNRPAEAIETFQRTLDLQTSLSQENRGIESRAGLALASLALGEHQTARRYVDEVLGHLRTKDLTGTEEPVRVFLACFHVLQANQDPRAPDVLDAGYRFLQGRQSTITDPALRASFLENVPPNRQLLRLWQAQRPS